MTLTLPASGVAAYRAISDWSAYATNRLLQIIRRKKDEDFHWFYCIEHQRRGALHWHICLYHSDEGKSLQAGESLVSAWYAILRDIGEKSGVDLLLSRGFARKVKEHEMQCPNQEMRKGCGAYFSKYASKLSRAGKTGGHEDVNSRNARLYPVPSFWGRSRNLKRLCDKYSFSFKWEDHDGTESESLREECFEVLSQFDITSIKTFSFKKEIEDYCGGSLTIAEGISEVFYVKPEDYRSLLLMFQCRFGSSSSSAIPERAKKKGGSLEPIGYEEF